jgi:predicted dehydrogenase
MSGRLWLIGAGGMAIEHSRVLAALGVEFDVIGRGEEAVARFATATGRQARSGGVARALAADRPEWAVVATGVDGLAEATTRLIDAGVKRLLVEKPAGVDAPEIRQLDDRAAQAGAKVWVAYNRRFYASVRRAREILVEDGGVTSFAFEFTEWGHQIAALKQPDIVKHNLLLTNSSHVIDLAFFLGGAPLELEARVAGSLPWHPAGAVFVGAGKSENGALFSYHANWAGPGRWGLELITRQRRLIFRPLEKLQIMRLASTKIEEEPIDDAEDQRFKPGLARQMRAFLEGGDAALPALSEHRRRVDWYERIAGR